MVLWPSGQAEVCKTSYTGSNPVSTSKNASLAQMVEHLTCNEDVVGSIPSGSSENGTLAESGMKAVDCKLTHTGSNPVSTSKMPIQLNWLEYLLGMEKVEGSTPFIGS